MQYTENSEPPEMFRKWVAIGCVAAAMQRKCSLQWDKKIYPNMYIVLCGPSGKVRKGTAMGPGQKLLKDIGIKLCSEATTREALIQEIKESESVEVDPSTGIVYEHCSLTVFSTELTVFLGYKNEVLMSNLTNWYDCDDSWTYRTKHQGTDSIKGVFVNLIGATTPELLQSTLHKDAFGGGLTSRMVFVFEERKGKTVLIPVRTQATSDLELQLQTDLQSILMLRGDFRVTQGWIDKWIQWYSAYDKDPLFQHDMRLSPYSERRPTHLLKLCMIVSASKRDDLIINEEDFDDADNILKQTEIKMPQTFRSVGKLENAEIIERVMQTIGSAGEIRFYDIVRYYLKDADKRELATIISTLESIKFCHLETRGTETWVIYDRRSE